MASCVNLVRFILIKITDKETEKIWGVLAATSNSQILSSEETAKQKPSGLQKWIGTFLG